MAEEPAENTNTPPTDPAGAPAGQPNPGNGSGDGAPANEGPNIKDLMATVESLTGQVKDLRKEAATYRTRAKEAEEKASGAKTVEERLAATEAKLAEQERKAVQATAKANLMQVVGNDAVRLQAALRVAEGEGLIQEDGSIDGAAFLEQFPIFKPSEAAPAHNPQPRGGNPGRPQVQPMADVQNMSHEEYEAWRANGGLAKLQRGELHE